MGYISLRIIVNAGHAAFYEDGNPKDELKRVLKVAVDRAVDALPSPGYGNLLDLNGDDCGSWMVTP